LSIIRSYPIRSAGLIITTPASAWGYGNYASLVDRANNDIKVFGLTFQITNIPTADSTHMILIELAKGQQGSEVTQVQLPYVNRGDTVVGYYLTNIFNLVLPEPINIKVGERLSVRAADSLSSAITYNAVKMNYIASKELVDPDMIENFKYPKVGNGMSTGERWR